MSAATERSWGVRPLPLDLRMSVNSARPWGFNDGPVWQGRGATTALSGGFTAQWGPLRARVNPVLWIAANSDFALSPLPTSPGLSPYSYPTRSGQFIDAPQRFGDARVARLDPGQSSLEVTYRGLTLGAATEAHRWGPGRRNPIVLSEQAGGFGHLRLGTAQPADVKIGRLHVQWLWGRLSESGYFDTLTRNDSRYITGATVSYFPKWTPGLELGANRVFVSRWRHGGPSLAEAFEVFIPLQKQAFADSANPLGNDKRDQMASLFARWVAVESQFELYAEWARGDHAWDLRDIMLQPEHASAFLLGFQKAFGQTADGGLWSVAGEGTFLGAPRTSLTRAPRTAFYEHHLVRQGYTQRGQVLGAGIGPGSSQVSLELARVAPWGRAGLTLQRTVYDNDRYYALYAAARDFQRQEVEPALLGDLLLFRGPLTLGASMAVAKLYNKGYVLRADETNLQLGLMARYHWR